MPRTRYQRILDPEGKPSEPPKKKGGVSNIPPTTYERLTLGGLEIPPIGPVGSMRSEYPVGMNGPADPYGGHWHLHHPGGGMSPRSLPERAEEFLRSQPRTGLPPLLRARVTYDEFSGVIIFGELEPLSHVYEIRGVQYGWGSDPRAVGSRIDTGYLMSMSPSSAESFIRHEFDTVINGFTRATSDSLRQALVG